MRIRVITLGEEGGRIAAAIAARNPEAVESRNGRDGELGTLFNKAFAEERAIVCVMAAGIALRMAAPLLRGKFEDPALVVVDDAARFAISMVSGHEGGANRLAYEVAAATGAEPVVTTGSETSRRFTLGIGCRRGAAAASIESAIRSLLDDEDLAPSDIRVAASIRRKAGEGGLLEALGTLDIPALFLPEEEVAATAKAAELEPSAAARHDLGVPSVAEPCALRASRSGFLRVPKRAYEGGVTLALVEEEQWRLPVDTPDASVNDAGANPVPAMHPGPRRGSLAIVGIGPGSLELLTGAARRAIARAEFVAGYGPYLELVAPLLRGKELFSSPMTKEAERARRALDEALSGRRAALVASGDACVYGIGGVALGMATEKELAAIDLEIHPGITAANAAAALVGSPFENDYAVLSLSDIITPRERILSRLKALAGAGFALALYNPRSRSRKDLLREAVAILLESRPASTPVAIVGDVSRSAERKFVCELGSLLENEEKVDMTSLVLIASAAAMMKGGLIVEPRGVELRDKRRGKHDAGRRIIVNSGSRKKAILVVSFGTSFEENLKATIGATEKRIGVANPDYEIRRAFTSSIVIGILEKRGIVVDTVDAAVRKLVAEGFPELIVQALHLIPGEEFHKLLASVAPYRASFARFAVGMPLFAGTDGYFGTIDAIAAGFPEIGPADAIVLMGHGSSHPANSAYALIQTIFEAKKLPVYIGTIEGYPTLDDVIVKLRKNGVRKTIVLPLMLVAGDHANNDMAGDGPDSWKSILGSNGFVVETLVRGLGQLPAIQDIYVARTKAAIDSLDAPGKGNA